MDSESDNRDDDMEIDQGHVRSSNLLVGRIVVTNSFWEKVNIVIYMISFTALVLYQDDSRFNS